MQGRHKGVAGEGAGPRVGPVNRGKAGGLLQEKTTGGLKADAVAAKAGVITGLQRCGGPFFKAHFGGNVGVKTKRIGGDFVPNLPDKGRMHDRVIIMAAAAIGF